jgi:aminoglycoside phosphotransferase (APT) family kinase protein
MTLVAQLRDKGLLASANCSLTPLTGGVSSEIYRVEEGGRSFVCKRALAKLKVAADWYADVSRNAYEQAFIRYVAAFRPEAVPKLLAASPEDGFFCMEYLAGYRNWKEDLLAGECSPELASQAGSLLGEIHRRSWGDPRAAVDFATLNNFDQLRIDPYLRATAAKHPDCAALILAEAEFLRRDPSCLVHGDYSPKNFLHQQGRLVLLDCEVAWFGRPSFDLAFFLNHFLLKALYHAPAERQLRRLVDSALAGYAAAHAAHADQVAADTARLLPMLLLARVDGKSPVEYLDQGKQAVVRQFARHFIVKTPPDLAAIVDAWFAQNTLVRR